MNRYLHGVTVAMVTPFHPDGTVNGEMVRRLARHLIDSGADCLYPLGTTGEMYKLRPEERKEIAALVVDEAAGQVPVYIHTGAHDPRDTAALTRHACDIGADGAGVITPSFFTADDRAMTAYYQDILAQVPDTFPVYLYNLPQCTGNDLSVNAAADIAARCPNAAGIKYSFGDMRRTAEYLQIRDGRFRVMQGADWMFLSCLAMGCDGTVSGVANVYPEVFAAIYQAYRAGELQAAQAWQALAFRICNALKCGADLALFKQALTLKVLDMGSVRGPQLDLAADTAAALPDLLTRFDREVRALTAAYPLD